MFKQIKIPNVLYEMAQDIERKKKRKIEKIFEEYIKEEWKKLQRCCQRQPCFSKQLRQMEKLDARNK